MKTIKSTMTAIDKASTLDDFIFTIQSAIFNNVYPANSKLPSERELAAQYTVSKTVAHDGLLVLVQQGFLISSPRRGYFVTDYRKEGRIGCLNAYLKYQQNHLDHTTFDALIEAILAIEGSAICKLAINKTKEDLMRLTTWIDKVERSTNNAQITAAFSGFHHDICYLCKNTMFPLLFNSFTDLLDVFYHEFVMNYGKADCIKLMNAFVECIAKGQGQRGYNLLGNLLRQFRLLIKRKNTNNSNA